MHIITKQSNFNNMKSIYLGNYVFITNHSGIGNDHLEPTVGDYEVEFLNDLMVRLINESLE